MEIGYARVSSTGQDLGIQLDALKTAGCDKIFQEKRSGTSTAGRDELAEALDFAREGDVIVVTRLDRLARSVIDLHQIIAKLAAKGVGFRALQQSGVDTTTSTGKLTLAILGAVAEFETDLRKERQREGIEKAKAAGIYKGRKPSVARDQVAALKAEGLGATEIAKRLGVGRASVYRVMAEAA
jgi:DNA invertase Pin-like site-specific DNA recombinase